MKETIISWDSTNIGENYPGITLPLTYSFIKDAYAAVYENYLALIGIRKDVIRNNLHIMHNMLGYVNGQVFYNIRNWYKFLTFMPGYEFNKKFFEDMLDPVIKNKEKEKPSEIELSKKESLLILLNFIFKIMAYGSLHRKFLKCFNNLYHKFSSQNLKKLDNLELANLFDYLQNNFFSIWAITIINDFRVMVFFGLLNKFAEHISGDKETLLREVYDAKKHPRSVDLIRKIGEIGETIKKDRVLKELFKNNEKEILARLGQAKFRKINNLIGTYLKEFGERSSNELKLEEPKFKEQPQLFIALIKKYAEIPREDMDSKNNNKWRNMDNQTKISIFQKIIFNKLKNTTVNGIHYREYYRIKRGKAFDMARQIFLEMGYRLKEKGEINDINDVFYLTKHEIIDFITFNTVKDNFNDLIRIRKMMFDKYRKTSLPRRITTSGLPGGIIRNINGQKSTKFEGQGTSKGIITAPAIVMESLDFRKDYQNKILVTKATDPGWTVIFPLLKGIITEQGGMLSHTSIISRELGIPCVVKIKNATEIIETGQTIYMNGETGEVRLST